MFFRFLVPLVQQAKQWRWLQIFTIYLRYLVGGAFIASTILMGKLSGVPMPIMEVHKPIGELAPIQQFFRVIYESGFLWQFIGWMQIICGALLLSQRWARLGAVMFFGMILNIFVITLSYDFRGTPIITGLMLLASIYLLLWEVKDLQYLVISPTTQNMVVWKEARFLHHPFWIWLGALMFVSIFVAGFAFPRSLALLLVPFLEGFIAFWVALHALPKR